MTDTAVRTDVLEIIVTLGDIEKGVRGNTEYCAFAQALIRMGEPEPRVWFNVHAFGRRWEITREARTWINAFDQDEEVAPERFLLKPLKTEHAA